MHQSFALISKNICSILLLKRNMLQLYQSAYY